MEGVGVRTPPESIADLRQRMEFAGSTCANDPQSGLRGSSSPAITALGLLDQRIRALLKGAQCVGFSLDHLVRSPLSVLIGGREPFARVFAPVRGLALSRLSFGIHWLLYVSAEVRERLEKSLEGLAAGTPAGEQNVDQNA